jgi:hypothetical protein
MNKITKHVMLPAAVSVIFFVIASIPVELLGCRNRGLIAAIVAGIPGIVSAERRVSTNAYQPKVR